MCLFFEHLLNFTYIFLCKSLDSLLKVSGSWLLIWGIHLQTLSVSTNSTFPWQCYTHTIVCVCVRVCVCILVDYTSILLFLKYKTKYVNEQIIPVISCK